MHNEGTRERVNGEKGGVSVVQEVEKRMSEKPSARFNGERREKKKKWRNKSRKRRPNLRANLSF